MVLMCRFKRQGRCCKRNDRQVNIWLCRQTNKDVEVQTHCLREKTDRQLQQTDRQTDKNMLVPL